MTTLPTVTPPSALDPTAEAIEAIAFAMWLVGELPTEQRLGWWRSLDPKTRRDWILRAKSVLYVLRANPGASP